MVDRQPALPPCQQSIPVQAMAAHNTGGKVFVQVERLVASGTLPSRAVQLPGAIVDKARSLHHRCTLFKAFPD